MSGNHLKAIPSIDELMSDPTKAVSLPPEAARILLIGLTSLQPLLIQRALMGSINGQKEQILLTVKEVAQRLKISEYRAYEFARQGALKSVRLGKSVRIRPEDLAAYIAQQGTAI